MTSWGEMGEGAGRLKTEKIYVYLQLIYSVVRQKPTQNCKAIILQLKIKVKKIEHERIVIMSVKKTKSISFLKKKSRIQPNRSFRKRSQSE